MNSLLDAHFNEWLNLAVRWTHLIAGIAWIGSSFYFMWLDATLEPPSPNKKNVEGELWMVHSGGFYQVEKRLIGPGEMPKTLHWFKWEAMFTLLTGLSLLAIVFYMNGGALLIDPNVSPLTPSKAVALSLGTIAVTWFLYDAIWQSRLASVAKVANVLSAALLVAAIWIFCHALSGRAAFVHVGALMGSVMVLNVWVRILPGQQKMIDATKAGQKPDLSHGHRAKNRSVHNSYMTFPVLVMMLSGHFPSTFGARHNWMVLILLVFAGAVIRHVMIVRMRRQKGTIWLVPALAAIIGLIFITAPDISISSVGDQTEGPHVAFARVRTVVAERCLPCHSATPTDDTFKIAPNGVTFDAAKDLQAHAATIRMRVFEAKTMPLANKTAITDEERALIGAWVDQGARLE